MPQFDRPIKVYLSTVKIDPNDATNTITTTAPPISAWAQIQDAGSYDQVVSGSIGPPIPTYLLNVTMRWNRQIAEHRTLNLIAVELVGEPVKQLVSRGNSTGRWVVTNRVVQGRRRFMQLTVSRTYFPVTGI